jgi:acetylornithine aminotransferase
MTDLQAQTYAQRWGAALMGNYGTPPLTLVRGSGAHVWDDSGREYLDLVAGIAVNALGHGHPAVVDAVSRQVAQLGHTSNLVINEPTVQLAERLLELMDPGGGRGGRVFFANSGAEANETALKLSRRTGRTGLVAADGGFHGRTSGSLSLTGQPGKRTPFEPLLPGVTFVPYGDSEALVAAVDAGVAAAFLEPVQGENGVVVPPAGYLATARESTTAVGALLVLDEVQTGIGRTGEWFAFQHDGLQPDVVTLAKGLGGGLPLGACVAFGDAATLLGPGSHGSTFGGNPVCAAAGLAVLDTLATEGLVSRARVLGQRLAAGIEGLGDPLVSHVRGRGLMLGVVLTAPVAPQIEATARDLGLLVNATGPDVVRLVPPLVLTDTDLDTALERLALAFAATGAVGAES